MKNTIIIILILLVVGGGIYYITSNSNSSLTPTDNSKIYTPPATNNPSTNPSTPTPAPPVSKTPPASKPSSVSVNIKNFSFDSSTLNVKIGTKVTWVNNDNVSHTVTSDFGNLLSSGTLSPGQSFSFTFNNAGSINYHCAIHPMMKGSVVVGN